MLADVIVLCNFFSCHAETNLVILLSICKTSSQVAIQNELHFHQNDLILLPQETMKDKSIGM
jgi:hypothetical protein